MKRVLWTLLLMPGVAMAATASPAQIERGQQVFQANCDACHGPGIGNPGHEFKPGVEALLAKYDGAEPGLLTERADLTPEYVSYVVRNGASVMPFFRKTEIGDADLAALAAYLSQPKGK
jgi:(+)-pinoresinol hydroxylase